MDRTITYFGIIRSITSWSKVSRELVYALNDLGVDTNIFERKGFLFDSAFKLDYSIKSRISNKFKGKIVFTFENPKIYPYLPEKCFKAGLLVCEYTELPRSWTDNINKYLNLVLVPSNFCREVFINSGVDSRKVRVLRYGYNPDYYYPGMALENKHEFIFLCVSAPHKREGLDLLIKAYSRAFKRKDPVKLIVKTSYLPGKNPKVFEYENLSRDIEQLRKNAEAPKIELVSDNLSEKEMGELYRLCDYYISLTRGEAFGLCFIEALACGKKVACINWGGQSDFLNRDNALFINHSLAKLSGEEYEKVGENAKLALPDLDDAAKKMREIYQKCSEKPKGDLIFPNPQHYQWKEIAKEFLNLIDAESCR